MHATPAIDQDEQKPSTPPPVVGITYAVNASSRLPRLASRRLGQGLTAAGLAHRAGSKGLDRETGVGGLACVVKHDLPALLGFFEDEGEDSFRVAAFFFTAIELIFADADGEALVEGVDFQFGEAEGAH